MCDIICSILIKFSEDFLNNLLIWIIFHSHFLANIANEGLNFCFIKCPTLVDINSLKNLFSDMIKGLLIPKDYCEGF
ncbi:unnamed protein product [Moneuplotes crassus]|uniref:Uncharacterized protein n=1 Tax=Euplotes crassus TaxID=5936 RepID=A0AAD2D558_EUPCR|nr:unnamed protein product [Moneuplotes crassus]